MVKIAFFVPVMIVYLMLTAVSPLLRDYGIDPLARVRSQTEYYQYKVYAAMRWEPDIKWDFWR